MILNGSANSIFEYLAEAYPEARAALEAGRGMRPGLAEYQAMALFILARQYNRLGATILEFGTAIGYSACMLAQGAPLAQVVTVDPAREKSELARENLYPWPNVRTVVMGSVDLLDQMPEQDRFEMVFVDGDHSQDSVTADARAWLPAIRPGGIIAFHDYGRESLPGVKAGVDAVMGGYEVILHAMTLKAFRVPE